MKAEILGATLRPFAACRPGAPTPPPIARVVAGSIAPCVLMAPSLIEVA